MEGKKEAKENKKTQNKMVEIRPNRSAILVKVD